jgi:general secretion pathway protein G
MKRREAFSLVEILIVIVITGILAGSMLLVMGSGKIKAEATKLISDMRALKSSALMYFADNDAWPGDEDIDALKPYLDRDPEADSICTYSVAEEWGLLDMPVPLASLP